MPAMTSPIAPSTARTPPVGSSSSVSRRATPIRAMRMKASTGGLSAFAVAAFAQSVGVDVGVDFVVVEVLALPQVAELPRAPVVGRVGEASECAEVVEDVLAGVGVAGVGNGSLFEEGFGRVVGVFGVDPEECDALPVAGGELLEARELGTAGVAPGRPEVDHDGV